MVRSLAFSRLVAALSLAAFLSFSPQCTHAQEISEAPAEAQVSTNASSSSSTTKTVPDPADLEVSWRKMPARFLHDQKDMWLFPTKLGKAENWIPTAIIIGGTAAFIKEDPPLERKVRQTDLFTDYNKVMKSSISGGLITVVPVGFYVLDGGDESHHAACATLGIPSKRRV